MAEGITPDQIAQYIEASNVLRDLITEAHQATRDLRHEMKELRELRRVQLESEDVRKLINDTVRAGLQVFEESLRRATETATQKVYDRFDTIMLLCLGEDPQSVREGRRTVTELVIDFIRQRDLPIKASEEIYLLMAPETKVHEMRRISKAFGGRLPSGRGLDTLPIVTDSRIAPDLALLVIPPSEDSKRVVVELNLRTGAGADKASEELIKAWTDEVPAGFRKIPSRAEGGSPPDSRLPVTRTRPRPNRDAQLSRRRKA